MSVVRGRVYTKVLREAFACVTNACVDDVVDYIVCKFVLRGRRQGCSSYAKKRRANKIGRCVRCYRVVPKFYFTKRCDQKTCVPGVSFNLKVMNYINYGVSYADT
ncbi:MAG: nucleic acid binding protein [Xinjiang sediment betaflexivirus 1]|nr:MAG: nucleic acid binding protein [Xinjiang sediment betaflexivirus 1]